LRKCCFTPKKDIEESQGNTTDGKNISSKSDGTE
jgi:hypothetical protein